MTHWMEGDWPDDVHDERPEDKIVKHLIAMCRKVLPAMDAPAYLDELIGDFELAIDDAEALFEDNDPRSMGWVGDDGLP